MALKHGKTVDCSIVYAHSDGLDLDARSQWVSRGKNSVLNYLDN